MKARAGVSLAIVTTVEVEVEFELQVSSIFQQILKKEFNCICEGGGGGADQSWASKVRCGHGDIGNQILTLKAPKEGGGMYVCTGIQTDGRTNRNSPL